MKKTKASVKRFARDEPVADLSTEDSFGHEAYSRVLVDIVLTAPAPFTLGVYGAWGTGKTTISREHLKKALEREAGGRVALAYIDVWKYEDDSLRRQFLWEAARQLKASNALRHGYEPEKALRDLERDRTQDKEVLRTSWRRVLSGVVQALLTAFVIYWTARLIIPRAPSIRSGDALVLSLVGGAIAGFATQLGNVLVVGEHQEMFRSIDSPERFEKKFVELMDAVKRDTVVIVLDNLDRCDPRRVVEVLSTIKTFLEPSQAKHHPLFVIPCDEAALVNHLETAGESNPPEYLRKFFSATVRLAPVLDEESRQYATDEVSGMELGCELDPEVLQSLVQVVVVAFRGNPRRVKQFLNNVAIKRMLLLQREAMGAITPPISQEVAFLAKLTVIEEEWPRIYEAIQHDARLYEVLAQRAVGIDVVIPPRAPIADIDIEPLLDFLRGTRRISSSNVRAFTRLKLSLAEAELPDYEQFRSALEDGRMTTISDLLEETVGSRAKSYSSALISILREEVTNGHYDSVINIIDAAITLEQFADGDVATEVIEQLVSTPGVKALLPSLAPRRLLRYAELVEPGQLAQIVDSYLSLLALEDLGVLVPADRLPRWQVDVAAGLTPMLPLMSDPDLLRVRQLSREGPLSSNLEALAELSQASVDLSRVLDPAVIQLAASRIESSDLELDDAGSLQDSTRTRVLIQCLPLAQAEQATQVATRLVELINSYQGDGAASYLSALLQLAWEIRMMMQLVGNEAAISLVETLRGRYDEVLPADRWRLLSTVSRLFPALDEPWRAEAVALAERLASEPVEELAPFVAAENANMNFGAVPDEIKERMRERLRDRIRSQPPPGESNRLGALLMSGTPGFGWNELKDILVDAAEGGAFSPVKEILLECVGAEAASSFIQSVAEGLTVAYQSGAPGTRLQVLDILVSVFSVLTPDQKQLVREGIADSLVVGDASVRDAANTLLAAAEQELGFAEGDRRYVVERAALGLSLGGTALDESFGQTIDRLASDAGLLSEEALVGLAGALAATLGRNSRLNDWVSGYLVTLPLTGAMSESPVVALISAARSEGDESIRESLIRKAHSIANRDRRTRAWRALSEYLDQLMTGSEKEQTLSRELLAP